MSSLCDSPDPCSKSINVKKIIKEAGVVSTTLQQNLIVDDALPLLPPRRQGVEDSADSLMEKQIKKFMKHVETRDIDKGPPSIVQSPKGKSTLCDQALFTQEKPMPADDDPLLQESEREDCDGGTPRESRTQSDPSEYVEFNDGWCLYKKSKYNM